MKPRPSLDTALIHAGELRPRPAGAVAMPVFQSSTFEVEDGADYHDLKYIRLNNTPNHQVLHAKLAALEEAEAALVAGSGMAAISTALLTLLKPGDHFLAQRCLYGGTHDLVTTELADYNIAHTFIDGDNPKSWSAAVRPETRVVYCESVTNPLMEVADLRGLATFARDHGLISIIDNTFPTPVNFRPIAAGFDLVMHSATKYLNGHSDIVAGALAGRAELVERIRHRLNHLGGSLDPHACFLLHRGLKTLGVRVRRQSASALAIAEFLEGHDGVARVLYPGLPSDPGHARARELFAGFGGMLSFDLVGGADAASRMLDRVVLPLVAPSLGGVETLITRPASTSHAGMARADREALGIGDGLIRLSVGLEDADDLIADLDQALRG